MPVNSAPNEGNKDLQGKLYSLFDSFGRDLLVFLHLRLFDQESQGVLEREFKSWAKERKPTLVSIAPQSLEQFKKVWNGEQFDGLGMILKDDRAWKGILKEGVEKARDKELRDLIALLIEMNVIAGDIYLSEELKKDAAPLTPTVTAVRANVASVHSIPPAQSAPSSPKVRKLSREQMELFLNAIISDLLTRTEKQKNSEREPPTVYEVLPEGVSSGDFELGEHIESRKLPFLAMTGTHEHILGYFSFFFLPHIYRKYGGDFESLWRDFLNAGTIDTWVNPNLRVLSKDVYDSIGEGDTKKGILREIYNKNLHLLPRLKQVLEIKQRFDQLQEAVLGAHVLEDPSDITYRPKSHDLRMGHFMGTMAALLAGEALKHQQRNLKKEVKPIRVNEAIDRKWKCDLLMEVSSLEGDRRHQVIGIDFKSYTNEEDAKGRARKPIVFTKKSGEECFSPEFFRQIASQISVGGETIRMDIDWGQVNFSLGKKVKEALLGAMIEYLNDHPTYSPGDIQNIFQKFMKKDELSNTIQILTSRILSLLPVAA